MNVITKRSASFQLPTKEQLKANLQSLTGRKELSFHQCLDIIDGLEVLDSFVELSDKQMVVVGIAIQQVLKMPTHNSVSKKKLLHIISLFFELCFEEAE